MTYPYSSLRVGGSLSLVTLLLTIFANSATPQSRPLGVEEPIADQPETGADTLRAILGDCPVDLLRRAWTEMDALQAVAVDKEVLRTCDERARAITGLMAAQRDGEAQLAKLQGTHVETNSTVSGSVANAPGIAALKSEVEVLRTRVETLEAQPGGSPNLPAARAALADAEARLVAAEWDVAAGSQTESPIGTDQDGSSQDELTASDENPFTTGTPGSVSSDTDGSTDHISATDSTEGVETPNLPEIPLQSQPGSVGTAEAATTPPDETMGWILVYTVRAGEGPWQAQVVGEGRRAVLVPALTEDSEPRLEWQAFTQGPFMLAEGDALPGDPDGRVVTAITRDNVMIRPVWAVATAPVPIAWHQGEDPNAPGSADWIVKKIEDEK